MGMIFRFSLARGCGVCFSLESPHRGDSAEYRQYNFFPSDSGVIANQPW